MATMNTKEDSSTEEMPTTGGTDQPFANFGWNENEDVSFEEPTPKPKPTKDEETVKKINEGVDTPPKKKTAEDDEDEDEQNNEDLDSVFADWDAAEEGEEKPKPVKKETKPKGEVGDESADEDEDDEDDEPENREDFFKTLALELKEKGTFANVEIDDKDEIDEERFFELHEEEVEARAEDIVKGVISELKEDPTVAAMIKYVRNGGKATNYLASLSQLPTNTFPADYDVTDKKKASKLLEFAYRTFEEMDAEEVKDKLEWLEEKGKTLDQAEKYHKRIVKNDEAKTKALMDAQLASREKIKKDNDTLRSSLVEVLKEDKIGDFPFSAKEKKELPDIITKATVKVGEGRYITEFQAKMQEVIKTPKKLAILLKMLNNDFDTKDLVTEVNTTVVKKAKSRLADAKKNEKSLSGNKGNKARSLAEAFDE